MASSTGDDTTKKKSVVIVDMPEELIHRDILKQHFEQFGSVERLACSVSKKYAVIHFSTAEEAENAAANGTKIKPDAPPLKLYNRGFSGFGPKSSAVSAPPAAAVPTVPSTSSTKVVTRRKIVRTFNTSGSSGAATTRIINEPSFDAKPESSSSQVKSINIPKGTDVSDNSPSTSAGTTQQGPGSWRTSLKISRPSPFLRKKPSYGDKSGKLSTSTTSSATKNPFALPPRNMLSLDRRKISSSASSKSDAEKSRQVVSSGERSTVDENVENSSQVQQSSRVHDSACSSSEIILPDDDDEQANNNALDEEDEPEKSTLEPSDAVEVEPTSTLDVDETTEDVILNDDDEEEEEEDDDVNETIDDQELGTDEENVIAEGETDTQDTAEVYSEEEGEIHDEDEENEEEDEEQNEEDDEGDEDVYESPLKRAEEKAASSKQESSSASTSSPLFSFKLSAAKTTPSVSTGSSSSSLFKLPFTSPFALGDAPKPFSSSSFGLQLSSSNMSKIFAGDSSPTQGTSTTKTEKNAESKEKPKVKASSFAPVTSKKEPVTDSDKPKSNPFAVFASFMAKPSSNKPSTSSVMPSSSSSLASSSTEVKPSAVFSSLSVPKSTISGSSSTSSSSTSATFSFSKRSDGRDGLSSSAAPSSSTTTARAQSPYQGQRDSPNPLLLSFTPDTSEAQELFAKRCGTVEERYRTLEARDKLIRSRIPKTKVNVEQATKLIGTCPDMCPEKERYMRQFQRQLVPYETLPGQDHVVDHHKAIKVYSRSSADQEEPLPHELRPGPTLDFTMHYLLHYIVPLGDNPDENLSDWYNFLWDRTRSIRKDITQQQIIDLTAVSLYEKCARFHIHCASRLCELDVHSFDPKLNDENLVKCLQSLEHLYEDLRRRQVTCPSEPEFRAYQIMMNLNEGDALYNAQQLPSWILNSHQVQTALKLHHSIYTKNFVAFFTTVESLPYMTSCILHRYFFQVRSLALRCFVKAHCTLPKYETAMPISTLQRMLGYGSAVQSFSYLCEAHGIRCDENKVILKRKLFFLPEFPSIYRESHLIDSKLQTSVAEAINGGPLPDIDFANRKPHSSFNENGQLISGDIIGSQDSRPGTFIPPEPSALSRIFNRSQQQQQPVVPAGAFSFGGAFLQPKKDPLPVQPAKPLRQIESVCQAATTKLIEESVRQDVAQLSQARLEEAKKLQEEAARKRRWEQIASKLAAEYVERTISQHVDTILKAQCESNIRQCRTIDKVTESSASVLLDEIVIINLGLSARTELILAKEYHHRLLRMLEQIFQRLRARFSLERWIRFTRAKILERERAEEKRREELWNFPVVNSYSMSTKEVFRAFCGNSIVQPSLNKVDSLSESPESRVLVPTRHKRKSEGEVGSETVKVPRMEKVMDESQQHRLLSEMWEFPAVNSYSKTNRQVLEALCGANAVANLPMSAGISAREKRKTDISVSDSSSSPFKIHRPAKKLDVGRGIGEEIRTKANEDKCDLLKDIKSFLSQIKSEKQLSKPLEPYLESIEDFKKMCPDLNVSVESVPDSDDDDIDSDNQLYENTKGDWKMDADREMRCSILSGAFIEEGNLLSRIQKFISQVKQEKAKSWKTDTFLNDIDLSFI